MTPREGDLGQDWPCLEEASHSPQWFGNFTGRDVHQQQGDALLGWDRHPAIQLRPAQRLLSMPFSSVNLACFPNLGQTISPQKEQQQKEMLFQRVRQWAWCVDGVFGSFGCQIKTLLLSFLLSRAPSLLPLPFLPLSLPPPLPPYNLPVPPPNLTSPPQ